MFGLTFKRIFKFYVVCVCAICSCVYEHAHVDVGVFVHVLKTDACVWRKVCLYVYSFMCAQIHMGAKCVFVCAHVHVDTGVMCIFMCAHTRTREGKAQWASDIFLCHSLPFLRQGLSLDLELTDYTGQAEPRAPGIHLPPLPQGAPAIHPALLPQCCLLQMCAPPF